jgi:hypothetical protein
MDGTNSVTLGLFGLAIGQIAATIIVWLNGRNARHAREVEAASNKEALLAAAKVLDDRTARDRQWALEDRRELAATLAAKVEASAATVAATVEATASTLAAKVAADHSTLRGQVDKAEASANKAVEDLTVLMRENTTLTSEVGRQAAAAYSEANHVNLKISDLNKRLLERETEQDAQRNAPAP